MSRTLRREIMVLVFAVMFPMHVLSAAEPALIRSRIPREPLASTALATAGYSKRLHIMEIEFCNGAVYRYLDVPEVVYRDFMSAESKAQYYDWNIKGHYKALRLRTAQEPLSR